MNPNPNAVEQLLRQQRRWNQYAWPLIAAAAGLAVTLAVAWRRHPSLARMEKWGHLPLWWMGGLAATLAVATAVYWLRRKSVLQAAQAMDARWDARNRLETAAMLASAPDAIARAQREETAGFVRQAQLRPRGIPLSLLGGLVASLALAHLLAFASWSRPWTGGSSGLLHRHDSDTQAAGNAVQAKAKSAADAPPKATIQWNSPEAEIKAAAIEEVPLEAVADSTTGFHDAVLEISVNGESRSRTPIDPAGLKNAGKHTIQTSIYMDQLGVKAYDIVTYDLRAQCNGVQKMPDTASPVQFVEIKPLREDVHECPPTKNPGQCFNYITAIKSAQLRAMKENFVLAHTELAHDSADWKDENRRVGADQKTLEEKTGEVIELLAGNDAPEEILGLIRRARPEMADAAQKISAAENEPALAPQGKALALITEVEKYLGRCVRQAPSLVQNVPDPFDKKELELKRRDLTRAGELEILAKEQARLADDLANTNAPAETPAVAGNADPEQITGPPAGRESQIDQRIGALLDATNFVAEVTKHLEQGRTQAQASLSNLNRDDVAAAREPAAKSALELRLAAVAMRRAAGQVAKNELADALRALSDAAGGARITPAQISDLAARQQATNVMNQVQNAARNLTAAARQQQETGSAKAAQQLNDLAKALADTELQQALQRLREQPRDPEVARNAANQLQDLADRAGLLRNNGPLQPAEVARLVDRLERAHANIQRLTTPNSTTSSSNQAAGLTPGTTGAGAGGSFGEELISDVREAALEALPALPQSPQLAELRDAFHASPNPYGPAGNVTVFLQKIDPPLQGVIELLRAQIRDQQRPFELTDQDVAQAPAAYRPAVADYFEKLSRDYETAPPAEHK